MPGGLAPVCCVAPWGFMVDALEVTEKKKSPSKETTAFSLSRVSVCIRLACLPGFQTVSRAPSSILAFFLITL